MSFSTKSTLKLSLSFIINLESFESIFKLHFSNIFCFNSLIIDSEFISMVSFISLYLIGILIFLIYFKLFFFP